MGSAFCFLWTSTSVSVPEDGQDRGVNERTAVCLVPVPMAAHAALCLVVATNVPALPATQVLDALMTQMNVPPHPQYAKMMGFASTPLGPTSVSVLRGLRAGTVKVHTSLVHRHHVLTEAPATRTLKPVTHATACQDLMGLTVRTTLMTAQAISVPMGEPVWTESTPTTVSALQSGLVSTAQKMWMSVVCSQTLARMEERAATLLAAMCACASMAGADLTALKTLTTVLLLHAAKAPHALTV